MKINKHRHKSKLIVIEDSSLLVLEKNDKKRYVFIGGFLKKRESPEEGLIREIYEETGVILNKNHFKYYTTNTIINGDKNALSRHYFILTKKEQKFINKEPEKFKSLKWVKWTKVIKFTNSFDKNIIERLFNTLIDHETHI
ncbi:NUDIX hydrolase [uncultured Psychroserpens sp.]|uniref:NUDIX hydrolase n=1 Tax=uncultured Psychroserpens sp. TaxID=255436 RepID=UPI0026279C15|nr:NUDIX hydrolase [uncultured Psychroserpens sp.]